MFPGCGDPLNLIRIMPAKGWRGTPGTDPQSQASIRVSASNGDPPCRCCRTAFPAASFRSRGRADGLAAFAQAPKTQLQVYTTLPPKASRSSRAHSKREPNIEIVWRRESTGTLTARIIAESEQARGDVIWGLAVTSMLDFKRRGILEPYAPKNLAALRPLFRDAEAVPHWIGMEAWVAAICFNTIEAQKQNLPRPEAGSTC